MSVTIRIDNEVYAWLQSQARPFEDTPNSVLRRIFNLDDEKEKETAKKRDFSSTQRTQSEKTPQQAFREPILKILKKHNGKISRAQALRELEIQMADQLNDYDKGDIASGSIRWQKSAEWEVRTMREDGLLKPVSATPRGIWALADKANS